jgi:S1-C subfamily serine protease
MRWLQHQVDSLARVYNENDQLSGAQRRRVEDELRKIVERLGEASSRVNAGMLAPSPNITMLVTPGATASMWRALMQVREAEQARPRGWIGFVAQGAGLEPYVEGGELMVRYFSYPRIVSVDPSSPAQRAGITTKDTLLAYDGRDVRENDISLTRLLRPRARVSVRLLRDGQVIEVPVTVAAAPSRIVQRRDDEVRIAHEPWLVDGVPEGPTFPRVASPAQPVGGGMRVRVSPPAVPPMQYTPSPSARPRAFFLDFSNAGVAGAELKTITEGLGQAIGVSSGVLVTGAPVGSPAYESGLRDGDVIVKVTGQAVKSVSEVRDLVRFASDDGERTADIEILRQKKTQKLRLKW